MALYYSEREAVDTYKQAILDHRDQLESLLYPRPWVYLQKSGCFKENDEDIEALKKLSAKVAVKKLVDLLLTKCDVYTFTTFSKAVHTMNDSKGRKIFPFADGMDGLPVTVPNKTNPQELSDKPAVLWLVPSRADHDRVVATLDCSERGGKKSIGAYYCQEFAIATREEQPYVELSIHFAYPSGASASTAIDPVDLLFHFSPRPHIAVLTGTCCANRGEANLGDVVITPRTSEPSLFAELQHMTELWRLESASLVPEALELPQSVFQKMACLARLYAELQFPMEERSKWFKELKLDLTKPLRENRGVRRCVPEPEKLLQSREASGLWSYSEGSPFHYIPCERLLNEATASMLFASDNQSPLTDPTQPKVVFGRAGQFKGSEGRCVCSPEAVNFYRAALMLHKKKGLLYLAALGVSSVDGQDCKEEEYEHFGGQFSAHVMWKIVNHLLQKLSLKIN